MMNLQNFEEGVPKTLLLLGFVGKKSARVVQGGLRARKSIYQEVVADLLECGFGGQQCDDELGA